MEKIQKTEELIWQDLSQKDALIHLLKTGNFSDIDICVGANKDRQRTFKCHKFVLLCASSYFEAMFYGNGDFIEKNQTEITMTDIEPEDFKYFLRYAYSRKEIKDFDQLSMENLLNFIYIGKKFLMPKYSEFGYIGITKTLPKLRLVDLTELFGSIYSIDDERLFSSVLTELQSKITGATAFNQILLEFDFNTFNEFIKCIKSKVTEYIRFKWIEKYIDEKSLFTEDPKIELNHINKSENNADTDQPEQRNSKVEVLLETICYEDMSAKELDEGPLKSKLLKTKDLFDILINKTKKMEKDLELAKQPRDGTCNYCNRSYKAYYSS